MTVEFLPKIKRLRHDPYSAGRRAYERGEPFDPDFGLRFAGWGTISAQRLYESGRLSAAGLAAARTAGAAARQVSSDVSDGAVGGACRDGDAGPRSA
jgi:hypothetical protein